MQKLPIGTSDYQVLKQENDYYIDKTKNIIEFLTISGEIILMPRPRRFGKTLFQSTLYTFSVIWKKMRHSLKRRLSITQIFSKNILENILFYF